MEQSSGVHDSLGNDSTEAINNGLKLTLRAIEALLGMSQSGTEPIRSFHQAGYHGYAIEIHPLHLDYFSQFAALIKPNKQFPAAIVDTWTVLNSLLFRAYQTEQGEQINLSSMAAFMAFPILEEVCRTISGRWDSEGKLFHPIDQNEGIQSWKEGGALSPVKNKSGAIISSLSTKYQLMLPFLQPQTRQYLSGIEKILLKPLVEGVDCTMSPLHARLYYWRNQWMHGSRYQGWEAVWVSLLLATIYFSEEKNLSNSVFCP